MSGSTLDLSGYKLTFDDEFNTFSWNPTATAGNGTWQTNFYFGGRSLPSNGELEIYSDSSTGTNPFSITSGGLNNGSVLDIQAAPAAGGGYTSGLITTEPSFTQTYGYFEMSAELPQGSGLWPAFWLLPADKSWPPELDPMEAFGATYNAQGGSTSVHIGAISADSSQSNGEWVTVPGNIYTGYHAYGIMWDPTHLTYYIDGTEVAQFATPADMDKPMYMLANLAVGGTWPGNPTNANVWPADMKIDYIHAYSNNPNAVAVTPQAGYGDAQSTTPGQTPAAAAHSAPPVASVAPTTTVPAGTTHVTSGDNFINDTYGDSATRYGGSGNDTFVVADPNV
jgi:serralysin